MKQHPKSNKKKKKSPIDATTAKKKVTIFFPQDKKKKYKKKSVEIKVASNDEQERRDWVHMGYVRWMVKEMIFACNLALESGRKRKSLTSPPGEGRGAPWLV